MNVYMLQDVENIGMKGMVIKVSDGYAHNFLLPRKLATQMTKNDEAFLASRSKKVEVVKKVLTTKIAMLGERITNLHLTIQKRVHDTNKLYGSISADEIVELLAQKEISINRKQVDFSKAIKTIGEHKVMVRLSSKICPEFTLKVVGGKE
jgi:large subunit ribosomal protein L9